MQSTFPVRAYFDPEIYRREFAMLVPGYPGFLCGTSAVERDGSYYVAPHTDDSLIIVNAGGEFQALTNTCRHRQSKLLTKAGCIHHCAIVCPVHKWKYDFRGKLLSAPGFDPRPNLDLMATTAIDTSGFLVNREDHARRIQAIGCDLSGHVQTSYARIDYDINWKEYIDVFMDNYHVTTYHPGLKTLVDIDAISWEFGEGYSVQRLGFNSRFYAHPGSPAFERYAKALGGRRFEHGAVWVVIYPNLIIELLQDFVLVSVVLPDGVRRCSLHVYCFVEASRRDDEELIRSFEDSMNEVEGEDGEILNNISRGRYSLYVAGLDDHGPYHEPTEVGMHNFHEYIRDTASS